MADDLRKEKSRVLLERIIAETREQIIELDLTADTTRAATEVEAAGLQARYWRTVSLLEKMEGRSREAKDAAIQACKFSEQQSRALRATIADRLADLEKKQQDQVDRANGLRLVT